MFKNYFKAAWRNLLRNKSFSVVNIAGLALGMTSSIFILLWVQNEKSYNEFHANKSRLFLVMGNFHANDKQIFTFDGTSALLADGLKQEIPEVKDAVEITHQSKFLFGAAEKLNKENGVYATNNLFSVFNFPMAIGNKSAILLKPDEIVISKNLATNYFGSADAIGKTIRIDNKNDFRITGVFDNIPENSTLQFDFVLPFQTFMSQNPRSNSWTSFSPQCYVFLNNKASEKTVNAKLKNFIQQKTKQKDLELFLQPLTKMHLYDNFKNGIQDGGKIEYVQLFTLIAVFILLIACINFMNLSMAKSFNRAKETGIRKVVGSNRTALILQFIGEAIFISILSIGVSVALIQLLLPFFNAITQKNLILNWADPLFIAALLGVAVFTGIISGIYPAFFLSSLTPIKALGKLKFSPNAIFTRKSLVVFQFTLCVVFIISTIVIQSQVRHIQNKNLGFDRNNVVALNIEGNLGKYYTAFKEELLKFPLIQSVATSSESPVNIQGATDVLSWPGKDPELKIPFSNIAVGYDFITTMKMQLKAGRDFSPAFASDGANIIVNETAISTMHLRNAVGATISLNGTKGTIVGIVKDFNYQSLHAGIQPLMINLAAEAANGQILVRYQAGTEKDALSAIKEVSKKFNPDYPFNYSFLDESFNGQYHMESVIQRLCNYFAFFAICISSLGLFGLSLFSVQQQYKEIAVRKVLGASASGIVFMFSKTFLKLVLLASVIAAPISRWIMNRWLQNYAYRIHIQWWMFLAAATGALLIAFMTISFQTIKAAVANPVKSLRTE